MIPRYEVEWPDGWRPTAWEPWDEALQHLSEQALRDYLTHHPASSDAYNALGVTHALRQQWPEALAAFDAAVMLTNQYHHYIHYHCSALHILRAEWAQDDAAREAAIKAALFQDHTNVRALALQTGAPLPDYPFALWHDDEWPGKFRAPQGAITDIAWNSGAWLCRDAAPLRRDVRDALALHAQGDLPEAHSLLEQAVPLAEQWHKHYHRQASIHRLQRGRVLEAMGDIWLARDEYRQAHDIDPGFDRPIQHRDALARLVKEAGLL